MKNQSSARKSLRVFVPLFHELNANLATRDSVSWFKFPSNFFLRIPGHARCLQTSSIFTGILCLCGQLGSATIELDLSILAAYLRSDVRTVQKAVKVLLEENLLVVVDDASLERKPEKKEEAKKPREKRRKQNREFCDLCGGTGLLSYGSGVVPCSNCE
jgi:hypothetical protein